mgnify:CR=1 FL=1
MYAELATKLTEAWLHSNDAHTLSSIPKGNNLVSVSKIVEVYKTFYNTIKNCDLKKK